jgi:hypothetical protein
VVLLSSLVIPSVVLAASSPPDQTQVLDAMTTSASGALVGNSGGAFQLFRVAYQGGSTPVLFTLVYETPSGGSASAFGFNLYGPSGQTFASQVTATRGNATMAQFTLVNDAALSILVQVYNYGNGTFVPYSLTVTGLSGEPAPTASNGAGGGVANPATPVPALNSTMNGSINGNAAGNFTYYNLDYPGGNAPLVVTMNVTPFSANPGKSMGFNLYRVAPNGATLVASGVVVQQDQNSATLSAMSGGPSAGVYQVQVFNYWQGSSVNYSISATGLAGPVPAASGNQDPAHAITLDRTRTGASGSIAGNRTGSFDYYQVSYPGNNAQLAIAVTYQSVGRASLNSIGFQVYNGSTLVGTVTPGDDGTGVVSGDWSYQNATPATFGIQVFNYDPVGAVAAYTLYQAGGQ